METRVTSKSVRVQRVLHVGISIMKFPPSFILNVNDVLETRPMEILEKNSASSSGMQMYVVVQT